MRALLLTVLLLAAAGCDTVGTDVVALDDVLVLGLVANEPGVPPALTFVTEGTPGCAIPIAYRTRVTSARVSVEVDGLEVSAAPACRALIPSRFTVAIPSPGSRRLDVEVRHRGATDLYQVRIEDRAWVLVPLRTSSTRPGPR